MSVPQYLQQFMRLPQLHEKRTNVKIEPCPISIIIGTVGNSASIMLAGIPFKKISATPRSEAQYQKQAADDAIISGD